MEEIYFYKHDIERSILHVHYIIMRVLLTTLIDLIKLNRVKIMLNLIMTDHILNVIIVITKVIINLSCRIIYLLAIKCSPSSMFSRDCKSGNLRVRKIYTNYVVP